MILILISKIDIFSIFNEITLSWMSQDLADDESTLLQVMDLCRKPPKEPTDYNGYCFV